MKVFLKVRFNIGSISSLILSLNTLVSILAVLFLKRISLMKLFSLVASTYIPIYFTNLTTFEEKYFLVDVLITSEKYKAELIKRDSLIIELAAVIAIKYMNISIYFSYEPYMFLFTLVGLRIPTLPLLQYCFFSSFEILITVLGILVPNLPSIALIFAAKYSDTIFVSASKPTKVSLLLLFK